MVSSHFGYKEDYVFNRSVFWLNRKYEQADREIYEDRMGLAYGVYQGISLALDVVFNNGKSMNDILPTYDVMKERINENVKERDQDEFVKGIWWKPEA